MGLKPIAMLMNDKIHAALVSRECETNETSETGFLVKCLLVSVLLKLSETE